MAANHGLRTTGIHTGNFGKAKVQGKRETLDFSQTILTKENLRIPPQNEAFTRLQEAYNTTSDPKLKAFLAEQLAKRKAATTLPKVTPNERPASPYWENIRRVRG
jgi:hypothetical protein